MKKRPLFLLLMLIMLGIIGFFYIKTQFIPTHLKNIISEKTHDFLQRPITIEEVQFNLSKGLTLKNLKIYQKNAPEAIMAHFPEISISYVIPAIFKEKTIIIPSIKAKNPFIHIRRFKDSQWNFNDILNKEKPNGNKKSSINLIIKTIKIINGSISLIDESQPNEFQESIKQVNANISIHLDKSISLNISAKAPTSNAELSLKGAYNINKKELSSQWSLNKIPLHNYLALAPLPKTITFNNGFFTSPELTVTYENDSLNINGKFDLETFDLTAGQSKIKIKKAESSDANISWHNKQLSINGKYQTKQNNIQWNDAQSLQGDIDIYFESFTFNSGKIQHTGKINTKNFKLSIGENQSLSGDISTNFQSFTLNQNDIYLLGNMSAHSFQWKNKDDTANGNIKATSFSLKGTPESFQLTGEINLTDGLLNIDSLKNSKTDIQISNTSFIKDKNNLTLAGDINFLNTHAEINSNLIFDGFAQLSNAKINYQPEAFSLKSNIKTSIDSLILGKKNKLVAHIQSKDFSLNVKDKKLSIQGNVDSDQLSIQLNDNHIKGNAAFEKLNLSLKDNSLKISSNLRMNNADILFEKTHMKGNLTSTIRNIAIQDNDINVDTLIQVLTGDFQHNTIKASGAPIVDIQIQSNLKKKNSLKYSGVLTLSDITTNDIPKIDIIESISGKISFQNDLIETKNLSFKTLNTNIALSGNLNSFKNPKADIRFTADKIDLEILNKCIPDILEKQKLSLLGEISLEGAFNGYIDDPLNADITLTSQLHNINLKTDKLKDNILNISGNIDLQKDLIEWNNIKGSYQGTPYKTNGQLKNFSRPTIKTNIESDNIYLDTEFHITKKEFRILSAKGHYQKSSCDIEGDLHLFNDEEPDIDLRGTIILDLENLYDIPNETLKNKLAEYNPQGLLHWKGLFRGKPTDWKNWDLTFHASAPKLSIKNIPIDNIEIEYSQQDNYIKPLNIKGNIYDGELQILSSIDLSNKNFPIEMEAQLLNLNLAKFSKQTKTKNQDLSGDTSLALALTGPILKMEKIRGTGSFAIYNGYLGQMKFLKGLIGALLVIPEYKNLFLSDLTADFEINNKKLVTANAKLSGKNIVLLAKGWIDMEKNIHFKITPDVNSKILNQSESVKKIPTALLSTLVSVDCKGTIKNPSCRPDTSIPNVLGTTGDILQEGSKIITDVLGDLLSW